METSLNQPPKPSNYLILAIISVITCCLPASIVSIIYAVQVDSKYNAGDYDAAVRASKNAKTWLIVSVVFAILIYLSIILAVVFFGADEFMEVYEAEMQRNNY